MKPTIRDIALTIVTTIAVSALILVPVLYSADASALDSTQQHLDRWKSAHGYVALPTTCMKDSTTLRCTIGRPDLREGIVQVACTRDGCYITAVALPRK